MPCPGPRHCSHFVDYVYDFCPLPDPDVGLSIIVRDVEHTSFQFGLCARKFVLCLFGQCPGLNTICHSWQLKGGVHLSPQADGNVAFEEIPVFGVCRRAYNVSSFYLFVMFLFLHTVVLIQAYVAFKRVLPAHCSRWRVWCLQPPPLYLRCSSTDPFNRIVLVAAVIIVMLFLIISIMSSANRILLQQSLSLYSRPCSPSLTF